MTASGGFEEQVSDRFLRLLASTRESSEREVGEKEEWWRAGDGRAVSTHVTGVSEAGARRNSGPAKIVRSFSARDACENLAAYGNLPYGSVSMSMSTSPYFVETSSKQGKMERAVN